MTNQSAFALDDFLDFGFGLLAAEAQLHELSRWQASGTFRREWTVSVQGIVHVDYPSVIMRADRDTSAKVSHDQVHLLVLLAAFLGISPGDGLLIQGMENRHTFESRVSADTGHVLQFVYHHRVSDIGLGTVLQSFYDIVSDKTT